MSTNKAILAIVVGLASIVFGITTKQFYEAGIMNTPGSGKPIARRKGRLMFVVVGIAFLTVGIAYFFTGH